MPTTLTQIAPTLSPPPEKKLMLAIFKDAWEHRRQCTRSVCLQCRTDTQWARDTATTFLYAFQAICDVLGFDGKTTQQAFLPTCR